MRSLVVVTLALLLAMLVLAHEVAAPPDAVVIGRAPAPPTRREDRAPLRAHVAPVVGNPGLAPPMTALATLPMPEPVVPALGDDERALIAPP